MSAFFQNSGKGWRSTYLRINPPLLLMVLYAVLVVVGGILLKLPVASTTPLSWSDALFTASSAVTVTGLSVIDIGSHLSVFGQVVVTVLIQLGGLGLMTFAVLVLTSLGSSIGMTQQIILRDDLNRTSIHDLMTLVKIIVTVVLVCEIVGAIALAFVFVPEFGWAHGIWSAVFHSISAFNNAGFSLYPDNLVQWATNPLINIIIPMLFIIGGLGYGVTSDILSRRRWSRYSLHTKLMLSGTLILILVSVSLFGIMEWNNPATLGPLESVGDRLWVSWFQGVTTRTAGFNTTDISRIHDSTALMFISLMLVGGGSTSTAGGIKVTTLIVLVLATLAFFKRQNSLVAFGRSIGLEQVMKVMALTTISILFVMIGTFVIVSTHDGDFLNLFFEVASAFGTVGLSRGATDDLHTLGRCTIMLIMFFGRVGPLTIGFFLATQVRPKVRYPESQIYLG